MNASKFDQAIQEELERAEAARTLKEIADKFPELFGRVAIAFLKSKETISMTKAFNEAFEDHFTLSRKTSPTLSVLEWLKTNGTGTAAEMIADLAGIIETTSENPGRIIHSTLASFERRKFVTATKNLNGEKVFELTSDGIRKHRSLIGDVPKKG